MSQKIKILAGNVQNNTCRASKEQNIFANGNGRNCNTVDRSHTTNSRPKKNFKKQGFPLRLIFHKFLL